MIKICIICGDKYENRDKRSKHCTKRDCKSEYNRRIYKLKQYDKICEGCNKKVKLSQKQKYCSNCRSLRKHIKNFKKIKRDILCVNCGVLLKTEYVCNIRGVIQKKLGICIDCKNKNKIEASKRMKGILNPNWSGGPKPNKYKTKEDMCQAFSERMTKNNPMKDVDTVNKVIKTIKEGYASGRIKKRFGEDNPNWKGNRENSFVLRSRLLSWKKAVLERDNFKCTICGINNNQLEIHHKESFRKIVDKLMKELKIEVKLKDLDNSSDMFLKLSNRLLEYHMNNIDIGITYCKHCHSIMDKKRHVKRGN